MQKLLTVVIPTYNTEFFLKDCLDSLLQGKFKRNTEIIVVDDGSKDKSGIIADKYAIQNPDIVKVIHKENGGHGSAINVGIRWASGKYFRVVDSDDMVEPVAYEAYLQRLEVIDCDLIATPFTCIKYGNGKWQRGKERKVEGAESLPKETVIPFYEAAAELHIRMHEWTIRTSILKERSITLSEHSFYVDMQYILFPIPWIRTVCVLPYSVYQYRFGREAQSISVKNMQKHRAEHQSVLHSLICYYKERKAAGDETEVLAYIERGIAKMEANQVQIALSLPIGKRAKKELVASELELKEKCPNAYAANKKKSLELLRKSAYLLYPAAALAWRVINKRKRRKATL